MLLKNGTHHSSAKPRCWRLWFKSDLLTHAILSKLHDKIYIVITYMYIYLKNGSDKSKIGKYICLLPIILKKKTYTNMRKPDRKQRKLAALSFFLWHTNIIHLQIQKCLPTFACVLLKWDKNIATNGEIHHSAGCHH